MELKITRSCDEAGQDTLVLAGSIDLVTRQSLVEAGLSFLDHVGSLTLDMAEVDFIDSTGVGALVELARAATSRGSSILISRASPGVGRVLEFSGLDRALGAISPSAGASAADR